MKTRPRFSRQTLAALGAVVRGVGVWQPGYALEQLTGLKSRRLYPFLIRLAERGLVEAERAPKGGHG